MNTRQVYAVGLGLGLLGSLVTAASQVLAGYVAIGVLTFGAAVALFLGLVNVFEREDFDREHSLPYRVANFGGAVFVVALGLLLLGVGVWSLGTFG
jgi:hypothetical protein